MSATVIDGKAVAARVREEVALGVAEFVATHGYAPGLATVLVGDDPASAVYVAGKQRACAEVGINAFDHRPSAAVSGADLAALIAELNDDPAVSGVLVQLPLPDHLDGTALTGRSNLFGKPMAQLLLAENATVTVCHSRTRDLAAVCVRADILIAAVGRPRMVVAEWVKPGAIVIDVGITRLESGLVGDVDFDAVRERAAAITPVPGGVGPMTIACLLRNTLLAARAQAGV